MYSELRELADECAVPLLKSEFNTAEFTHLIRFYLDEVFAPQVSIHGTLVDVSGVGLLFRGRSGIGKSEVALDLVERGHRLVADDIVIITASPKAFWWDVARRCCKTTSKFAASAS